MPDTESVAEPEGAAENQDERGTTAKKPRNRAGGKKKNDNNVNVVFQNATMHDTNLGFGSNRAERIHSVTGRRAAEDIKLQIEGFVAPDGYGTTRDLLNETHFVLLTGPPGIGKQTSALAMLHSVAPGDVEQLSPTVTLEKLCEHDFEEARAYLIADHRTNAEAVEAEFRWDTLPARIRDAGAFLVVTASTQIKHERAIRWQRPAKRLLLNDRLAGLPAGKALAKRVSALVPDDWTVGNLVECSRRLTAVPDGVDHALEVFDIASREEVQAWFDEKRTRRDIIEVVALAFVSGTGERRFEYLVANLEEIVAQYLPLPEADGGAPAAPAVDVLPAGRRARRSGQSLIQVERDLSDFVPRRLLVFSTPAHRRHVLTELAENYEAPLWNAVQEWLLDSLTEDPWDEAELVSAARGLALFAAVDFDDAFSLFIGPLSRAEAGRDGLHCAIIALRFMARDDALAPAVLGVVIQYVNYGNAPQRVTAANVLISELGARYPDDAAERLWQLITQNQALGEDADYALAHLLHRLVVSGSDATSLLRFVGRKLTRFAKPGPDLRMVDLVLSSTLKLLSIKDDESRTSVVLDLVTARPDAAEDVAALWAPVLCNRRYRMRALDALWAGLNGCRDDPHVIDVLGTALAKALPETEYAPFIRDFRVTDVRMKRHDKDQWESIAHLLIDALERMHGRMPEKEEK